MNLDLAFLMGPRAKRVWARLGYLGGISSWIGRNVVWMVATSAICLVLPVVLSFEREQQMFELEAQMEAMHTSSSMNQLS